MAVLYRSHTAPVSDSTTSLEVATPSGVVAGDMLLLYVRAQWEVPDGWQLLPGSEVYQSTGVLGIAIFYRIASASEPASHFVPGTVLQIMSAAMIAFRSDAAQPLRLDFAKQVNASSTNRTFAAVDVPVSGAALAYFATLNNVASTPAASHTERWDNLNPRAYCMTIEGVAAGVVGPVNATGTASPSYCVSVAISEGAQEEFAGPQYRGSDSNATTTTGGSATVDMPDEAQAGDLALLYVAFTGDRTPTISDWHSEAAVTGTENLYLFSKTLAVADLGSTITATFAATAVTCFMGIVVWGSPRGRALAIDDLQTQANGSSTNVDFPALMVSADEAGLSYFATYRGGAANPPPEDAERWDAIISTGPRLYALTELWLASGGTGTRTATHTTAGLSTTVAIAVVELEPACKPHSRYLWGGVELTDYCNSLDLANMPRELAAKRLGSTGMPYQAGVSEYSIGLAGDWNATIDALLGADSLRGTKRSSEAIFDDCDAVISYAWAEAFVTDWKVTAAASSKLEWSATLRHNGQGVRSLL